MMLDPQLDADGNLIHLLSTEGLSREQLTRLLVKAMNALLSVKAS